MIPPPRRADLKLAVVALLAAALGATTFSARLMNAMSHTPFAYSAPFLALVFALVLPWRWLWLSPPLAAAVLFGLGFLNRVKISILSLPITYFDLRLAMSSPAALINALGLNDISTLLYLGAALAVVVPIAAGVLALRVAYRRAAFAPRRLAARIIPAAAVCFLIAYAGERSLIRYARYYRDSLPTRHTQLWQDLWLPASQVTLSTTLGVPEYLVFSALAERDFTAPGPAPAGTTPTGEAIREAAASFVHIASDHRTLPNIVILHAESTFDPNRAFSLASRVDVPLWSGVPETRALGPLHVNVVGGGSWVTDFEVITGVDSRLFGFQGYYTTYYVAPMVRRSFATYLASKGYRTAAFFTVVGDTYNYGHAFERYGFHASSDAPSLGMTSDWDKFRDRDFVTAIARSGAFDGAMAASGPFLYFVDTTENHGPHPCRNFSGEQDLRATYAKPADFSINCQLNEYVRRAASTSDAFVHLIALLRSIEASTGRPYVVLAFGDHQPWDFTEGVFSVAGGNATGMRYGSLRDMRTDADVHETFFHIAASEAGVVTHALSPEPPATFLPTLLSAFVASSYDDLYLPQNFYLLKHCGTDFAAHDCASYPALSAELRSHLVTGDPPR